MFKKYKQQKFNAIIEELEKPANELDKKYTNINGWIESNKDSDPNLCEMIESICDFGELCGLYNYYYKKYDAYPIIENEKNSVPNYERITDNKNGTNQFKATKHAVAHLNPNLKSAKESLDKMINLRHEDELFNDPVAENLLFDTYKAAVSAEFRSELIDDEKLRKNILSKCGGIYNFIHQEKLKNSNYKYDNKEEFEKLKKMVRNYEFSSKYAQFSYIIDNIMEVIDKNYLYSENKENTNIK